MTKPTRRKSGSATIQDVAREAGVSAMTVSRVVNGGSQVRSATRDAVMEAIEKLSYQPNSAARTLAAGRAAQIGLLYSNPSASYLSQFLIGTLEGARAVGSHLLLQPCDDSRPAAQAEAARQFLGPDIQGVILPPPLSESLAVQKELNSAAMPWVAIAMGGLEPGTMNVRIDDHAAAASMTRHLLGLGHRNIGFIKGHPNHIASLDRFRGFQDALREAGIDPDQMPVEQGYFTYHSGLEAARKLLARDVRPTAIFASNDDMAAAAMGVAHRNGLHIPADLSIVGFDDTELATSIWPELTTIRQPIAQMARTAVELLMERLHLGHVPENAERVLPHELILRDSSGPKNDRG
jgi:LacI family transcriptional regulator